MYSPFQFILIFFQYLNLEIITYPITLSNFLICFYFFFNLINLICVLKIIFIRQRFETKLLFISNRNSYQMIQDQISNQILKQAKQQINLAMNSCTANIVNSLQKFFGSLYNLHRQRQSEKDKIIFQQKEAIDKLKKINDFMDGFTQNYINFKNSTSPLNDHRESHLLSQIQQKGIFDEQIEQKESAVPFHTSKIKRQKADTSIENKILQKNIALKKQQPQKPEQKLLKLKQNHQNQRKRSSDKSKNTEKTRRYIRRSADNEQKAEKNLLKPSSQQKENKIQRVQFKSPLQCRSSHPLSQVSYTPNFTRLNFIQYEHKKQTIFNEHEVQIIGKHDLKDVTAFALTSREVTNEVLLLFTKLQLINLRSLRIENNKISDLRPLRSLNIKILQDVDVSNNPLQIESAYFLAMQSFDELIYLTVSFETGLDDQYWKILLNNQMQNYPKLEALDVCNENQLSSQTKKSIQNCILRKTTKQKRKSGQQGYPVYPQNYQIKITWNQSLDIFTTYSQQKQRQIGSRWQISVNYQSKKLERLAARKLRNQFQAKTGIKNHKKKTIRKSRARRPAIQSKMRKIDQQNSKFKQEDLSVESGSNSPSEQEASSD